VIIDLDFDVPCADFTCYCLEVPFSVWTFIRRDSERNAWFLNAVNFMDLSFVVMLKHAHRIQRNRESDTILSRITLTTAEGEFHTTHVI
jgi:hypothetical protein